MSRTTIEWAAVRLAARRVCLAALSPLLEKNAVKTLPLDVPVVFSMSRVIVIAFAVAMLRQIWNAGIAGWPDATLAIAIVLALPILSAFERVKPSDILELANTLVSRFGIGATCLTSLFFSRRPIKLKSYRIFSYFRGRDEISAGS